MSAKMVGVFLQECFASFLMLVLLFPFGSFLGDTWMGWTAHFFCVMLHDWITGGSQVNPAVSIATTLYGWNTPASAAVRIAGQLVGGLAAFPVVARVLPPYVKMGGPMLNTTSVADGCAWEFGLTFALLILVYVAATQIGLPAQRPIIAGGIRTLIYYGGKTGPAMNPMIALSWAYYAAPASINMDHFLVYWVSSTAGAIAATLLWKAVEPKRITEAGEEAKDKYD
ncbi:aquaporin-like protein [Tribonema minus]|uniref:Aquaporin-like protein n=1 Tax=Tribonema minus TaxID=303371 RepID=A0A835Z8P0_9STRA|nr:aquaporin-like protein [Tribonema minus]